MVKKSFVSSCFFPPATCCCLSIFWTPPSNRGDVEKCTLQECPIRRKLFFFLATPPRYPVVQSDSGNRNSSVSWTLIIKQASSPMPNHQRWRAKLEAQSEHVHVACTFFFARSGTDLRARSVLIDKISASEISQKSIRSALLVGQPMASFLMGDFFLPVSQKFTVMHRI